MLRKKFHVLLVGVVTLSCAAAFAQIQSGPGSHATVEINGQVRFTDGGSPAANVLVRLESYDGGGSISDAFTDRLGKFRFTGLSPAQYSVRVRQSGYKDTQQTVDLQTSASGLVMLQLVRDESVSKTTIGSASIDAKVPAAAQKEFDKGAVALATGEKDKIRYAIKCFEKAVSIYPSFVEARLKLGTAHMDLSEWDDAEKDLKATLEVEPKTVNALFALGEVYLQKQKLSDAESVLLRGLEIDDRSARAHLSLARVYWERARPIKELTEARPLLEKCYEAVKRSLQLNPDLAAAHLLKGNLLLRVTRTSDALVEFDEYLRLDPKGAFAVETRALVERIRKATSRYSSN